ncbi:MAG: non-homologous end-joining DNA ligase [Acidimicrobiia bacterium]
MATARAPRDLRPMLATLAASAPLGDEWSYEIKWDGIRAIVVVEAGEVSITSRLGNDLSGRYPELAALADAVTAPVVLDGEIVAMDETGRPSFELLQRRMHVADPRRQARFVTEVPVVLMVFDVLWRDGALLVDRTYTERRTELEGLGLSGPSWQTPAAAVGADAGEAMIETSRRLGLEGVVVKRSTSRYEVGRRSRQWLKVKHRRSQELVVGGWLEGQGSRQATVGALLVGYHDDDGRLHCAGRVGSGFTGRDLAVWDSLLAELATSDNPFAAGSVPKGARFVRPELVVEVAFTEWTSDGRLRHPVLLGRRDDVDPAAVRREEPAV